MAGIGAHDRDSASGVKYIADVNVSRQVVDLLRTAGFDIVRVSEIMDPRSPDEDILAQALLRGAVVISHDQDFTTLLATSGATQPSLVNVRVSRIDVPWLAATLAATMRAMQFELRKGAIVTLDDGGVRVHSLPVE